MFFGENAFIYPQDHDWSSVVQWLDEIGVANRGFLTKLELDFPTI